MNYSDYIFLVVGESGTGKTSLINAVCKKYGYKSIESYTTRQKRSNNESGHIFVTENEMPDKKDMVAYTYFAGNHYWATQKQVEENDFYIIDPKGVEFFKQAYTGKKRVKTLYIASSEKDRFNRMIARGDSEENVNKRIENDRIEFGNCLVKDKVFINNENCFDITVKQIATYVAQFKKINKVKDMEFDNIVYVSHPSEKLISNDEDISNIIKQLTQRYPENLFLNPVGCFNAVYDEVDYKTGILYCLWLLEKADEMWVFGDYKNSVGCNMEIAYCQQHNIPYHIFETVEDTI